MVAGKQSGKEREYRTDLFRRDIHHMQGLTGQGYEEGRGINDFTSVGKAGDWCAWLATLRTLYGHLCRRVWEADAERNRAQDRSREETGFGASSSRKMSIPSRKKGREKCKSSR